MGLVTANLKNPQVSIATAASVALGENAQVLLGGRDEQ